MTDTVKVWSEFEYRAWQTPRYVHFAGLPDEAALGLESAAHAVIDALAWQWLEHLYAGLNRPNPFGRPDCPRIVLANIPSTQPTTTMTELDGLARGINFAQRDRT